MDLLLDAARNVSLLEGADERYARRTLPATWKERGRNNAVQKGRASDWSYNDWPTTDLTSVTSVLDVRIKSQPAYSRERYISFMLIWRPKVGLMTTSDFHLTDPSAHLVLCS
jgi:hypothetical protein